ncbi:thrombospondin type-1 domain-containing protein 4 [Sinocyclocheilus rhinocerous]|uniref:thrombospondin type-1 domain-containing protein 4 n=1 Tax=Sinocyclocheilus rhinocerous TaxID=307959 RepID=UPI0007B7A898|nr:PREDICTED: thrombospondin type-1 domain-containing protein 4-like [Sinocyclocheilus rhinocerous]
MCHQTTRQIWSDPQQTGSEGAPSRLWSSWGSWGECSRSCGGGVQEQTRVCLPHYPAVRDASAAPQSPAAQNTASNTPNQRRLSVGRYGWRANSSRISPGTYGYSRMPYVTSLQKESSRTSHKQRRSASNFPHQSYRTHQRNPYQNTRHHTAAQPPTAAQHTQPQMNTAAVQSRPYNPLPNTSCPGAPNRHKICNSMACPSPSRPIRELQCSTFNTQPFMGRFYQWEPFYDVSSEQRCELNCRAVGLRFYVRQADRVIDGTPCGQNQTSVCVAGQCQSAGCDDLLGSGRVPDKCGVCGGDNSACKLVSGLFQHSLSKVGYHKIVEIPPGATKINVTEMVKSRNYLALLSRSGRSIINGNWAIDRPGMYEGVGTMFTYRRPNEISSTAGESFLAEGPTNEILDVFMIYQQLNPGVHYEFLMPSENAVDAPRPKQNQLDLNAVNGPAGSDANGPSTPEDHERSGVSYPPPVPDNQLPAAPHSTGAREYNWKLSGTTDCSASCGRGSRFSVFVCVHRGSHALVPIDLCDSRTKPSPQEEPCNVQPCPAFWDIGEWSECSKSCGLGVQYRQVLCLGQRSREVHCVSNVGDIVADDECNMKLRPSDVENCDAGVCTKSWFFSDWSAQCSADCGSGVRTRSIQCLTNHISSLPLERCGAQRPPEAQPCNNGPCESRTEWFTGPWSQCCGSGSQQRAVVCLMRSDEGFVVMPSYECSSLDKPLSQQSCFIKTCGAKWFHTDWSACSKTCETGYRVREVRCLTDDMTTSDHCEETLKPHDKEECHPEPCLPLIDEKCRDKYFNCNVVVQARLCVYDYYQMACCVSCKRVAQRSSAHWRQRS